MSGADVEQLLRRAHAELDQLGRHNAAEQNFLHAHMAALRAGAALLALYPSSRGRKRRAVRSVWEQIADIDESWMPWATFFAAGASVRAAIESGRQPGLEVHRVARTERAAMDFVALVEAEMAQIQDRITPSALAS